MNVNPMVLVGAIVSGICLGTIVWGAFWCTMSERTENIRSKGLLDWVLVALFFLSWPGSVAGTGIIIARLYETGLLIPFATTLVIALLLSLLLHQKRFVYDGAFVR